MPANKIVTNIYSALSFNNIGLVHFGYGKPSLAVHYFNKAQLLLAKGCTGVEDRDLQLFSCNYASHANKIYYNLGVVLLAASPSQSYQMLEHLKRSHSQCFDFKYWYRVGQAELEHFHQAYPKISRESREIFLESALKSFSQSLFCLSRKEIPSLSISKTLPILKEEEIEAMIMKMKGEVEAFRQSITLIICYICLLLHQYNKVIKHGKELIQNEKAQETAKIYALQYMMEAYSKLDNYKSAQQCAANSEKLSKSYKRTAINTYYFRKNDINREKIDMDAVVAYQNTVLRLRHNNIA